MKKRIGIAIVALLIFSVTISAQQIEQKYLDKLNTLKSSEEVNTSDVVINTNMIEKFYHTYNEVEVVNWKEVLTANSFDEAKIMLHAYNNLDMQNISSNNLLLALDNEVLNVKQELSEELLKKILLAYREQSEFRYQKDL